MSSTLISSLTDRLSGGETDPQLKAEIQAAVLARRGQSGDHRQWALLCEQAGLLSLAFTEFQLALRDDPHDPVAAFHLAQHYRERGDTGRAVGLLERLLTGDPARLPWLEMYVEILVDEGAEPRAERAITLAEQNGLAAAQAAALRRAAGQKAAAADRGAATPAVPDLAPTDADCVRFCTLFAGQEGVHARQWVRSQSPPTRQRRLRETQRAIAGRGACRRASARRARRTSRRLAGARPRRSAGGRRFR